MERKPGYYWIRQWVYKYQGTVNYELKYTSEIGTPEVAYWDGHTWLTAGYECDLFDGDVHSYVPVPVDCSGEFVTVNVEPPKETS